jgi:hypothetical protein
MWRLMTVFLGSVLIVFTGAATNEASARGAHYPLTRCGPELGYLCPIHGYFDLVPFHYNLAIYPGCVRAVPVKTPNGLRRKLALVCG